MLGYLWNIKIQIMPVVISLIICELPAMTRWFYKLPYIPIYFTVFPFTFLNRNLSLYLGNDFPYNDIDNLTEADIELLRKRIIIISLISIPLFAIVTPFIGGFLSVFFLPQESFLGFCAIFICYKLFGMIEAAHDFGSHAVANKKTMMCFLFIYLVYFGVFLNVFGTTYDWAKPFVSTGDWIGLLKSSYFELVKNIIINALILGLLSGLAYTAITDRKLRDQIDERLHHRAKLSKKAKKHAAITDQGTQDQIKD